MRLVVKTLQVDAHELWLMRWAEKSARAWLNLEEARDESLEDVKGPSSLQCQEARNELLKDLGRLDAYRVANKLSGEP